MKPRSSNRAFSLLEVIVYSTLLSLILGGVFMVLQGGMRYYRLADAQQDAQRQAVLGLRKLTTELTNAHQGALEHDDLPQDYVLFLSADAPLPASRGNWTYQGTFPEYKKWVTFYLNGANQNLVRAEQPLGTPSIDPGTEPVPDFTSDMAPLPSVPVMKDITDVDFRTPISGTLGVSVVCYIDTGTDRGTSVEMTTSVRIRNL